MLQRRCLLLMVSGVLMASLGCSTKQKTAEGQWTPLTAGMVKRSVVVGEATQTDVLEIFGPPDILTHRDGSEVWTYDKTQFDVEDEWGYFTVVIAGFGGDSQRSSSRSTMVIIYFDEQEIVSDYLLNVVRF